MNAIVELAKGRMRNRPVSLDDIVVAPATPKIKESEDVLEELDCPPSWYPLDPSPHATIDGLPSYVTLYRIRRWCYITQTEMRRLHTEVLKKRRVGAVDLSWWPEQRPVDAELPFLIAMGMVMDGSLEQLSSLHRRVNRSQLLKDASLFAPMIEVVADLGPEYVNPEGLGVFISFMESGDDYIRFLLDNDSCKDEEYEEIFGEFRDWLVMRHPDRYHVENGKIAMREPVADDVADVEEKAQPDVPVAVDQPAPCRPKRRKAMAPLPDVKDVLVEESLPGVAEAADLAIEAMKDLAVVRVESARLCEEDCNTINSHTAGELVRSGFAFWRTMRRRERLLDGPVEVSAQIAALRRLVDRVDADVARTLPAGRWRVEREAARSLLATMRGIEAEIVRLHELESNLEHMYSKLDSKKGGSLDNLIARVDAEEAGRDEMRIDILIRVEDLVRELNDCGGPIRVVEAASQTDGEEGLRNEIARLRDAEQVLKARLADSERRREALAAERDEAWGRVTSLQAAVERLQEGRGEQELVQTPETVDDLVDWAETGLGAHIVVLPRALRETRKCRDVNVQRLHEALLFLKDVYVPMRLGEITPEDFWIKSREARFEETKSFADRNSVKAFEQYWTNWNGRRIALDRHLKWGKSTELQNMLRVYFHWDAETATVVIGHMPSHLDNWKTN